MSLNENPIILRQSFNKLWKNNIYLLEESDKGLQFLSVYKSNLRVNSILSYKYRKRVSNRVTRGENDLDLYTNYYKYRKNKKHKKKENPFTKKALDEALRKEYKLPEKVKLVRKKKYRYTLPARREKSALFQQLLQPFTEVTCGFFNRLPRLREPIRRLSFFRKGGVRKWRRDERYSISRVKYFRNSINQIILLHYYKEATVFSIHFGRELARIRKQQHWKFISIRRRLIHTVPTNLLVGRHFYGLILEIAGRPKGQNRTVVLRILQGSLSSQQYRCRVSRGLGVALAKVGVFGIRTRVAY